jgi:hypothetical protein
MNKIVIENYQPGVSADEWDIIGADDGSIEGFATEISVNLGETVHFKINTAATAYRLDIYRMGYYAGKGARKVARRTCSAFPSSVTSQSSPVNPSSSPSRHRSALASVLRAAGFSITETRVSMALRSYRIRIFVAIDWQSINKPCRNGQQHR